SDVCSSDLQGDTRFQAHAGALAVTDLLLVAQRAGTAAVFLPTVHLHPRILGAAVWAQAPGARSTQRITQAQTGATDGPLGLALLHPFAAAQCEAALLIAVVQLAVGQSGICPEAAALVLQEGAEQIGIQLVAGTGGRLQTLILQAQGKAQPPTVGQSIAAAEAEAQALVVRLAHAGAGLEVAAVADGSHEGVPFTRALPVTPRRLPLLAQLLLVGHQAAQGHFRQQAGFPGRGENRMDVVRLDGVQRG